MSRFLPERLLATLRRSVSTRSPYIVGLSAHGAAWQTLDPMRQLHWQHTDWSTIPKAFDKSALTSWVQTLALPSGTDIHWMLAPSLIRHWLQSPPALTASLSELHAVAQARATQQFGPSGVATGSDAVDWTVAADWHATRPFLCAGIATELHQALHVASGRTPMIVSPLMLALSQYQHQLPRQGWLALALVDEFHVMQIVGTRISRLRSVRVAPQTPSLQWEHLVVQEWQREKLRAQSDAATLHWLNLAVTLSSETEPASPSLKPIRRPVAKAARAQALSLPAGPVSEAMQTAWCGQVLLAGSPP